MTIVSSLRKPIRTLLFALSSIAFASLLLIASRPAAAQPNGLPPIIDRELFFGDPEISGAQISPDGKFIAFIKPFKGTRNVWVKSTEDSFDKAKPITADTTRPIPAYFWSRDGKYILFVQDKAGDENYLVYAVNPADAPPAGQDVPAARNLTDLKGVRADIDLTKLELLDPATGKEEMVESDPLKRVDLGGTSFSEVSDELIATTYQDERVRIYWKDKAFEDDYKLLQKQLPGKEIAFASSTKDERLWLLAAYSDTEPGERYLFDRQTKKLTLQYRVREKLNRDYLAPMKAVHYKSSDGLEIPAYLTLPKGAASKNLLVVIFPHGGPWARDGSGYNPFAQFWANRGYAVLQPNFRGSTGYGKQFIDAGNKQWGDKMQDDITWGVKYLVAEGIADPKHVGIMGGSYGGYATLAGVTFTPDLYAGAVDYVGPSNLITLLETIPPYWESARQVFYQRMGDPNSPEGKAQLNRQSPLNSANKIKTPLLVVQGANDPRVNKREADQIVIALRDRGFPVEYIVAPDEGHGFARPVNNMAMFSEAEKFFAKYLGGRFQEGATSEVAQRLKEITVDVKSVTLPKKVEATAEAPKPTSDLQPGTFNYKASIALGGQSIPLSVK